MSDQIWLEVSNVRLEDKKVLIQVKGDKEDREPAWREVELKEAGFTDGQETDHNGANRTIADALDKKRIVLAKLVAQTNVLKCTSIRVQYAESNIR